MGHAYCVDCGAIISCGDGGCSRCEGKVVASNKAGEYGHWGRCDKCFAKLPEGTKSEYVISYEKELSNITDELERTIAMIRDLGTKRKLLDERKAFFEKELAKYQG